ncbi:kinesin-like protein KIN-7K, chloroplastic [Canna indica]|uniref:Kinesin-like protein KIN-7K, chloroplastic n=1 Tax=Canna indica TaxID=4628 RepID=A0AAQ3KM80_9LILI|nr:kinesin-like protein KIN-7K, chloroplastic [Canna indica]
MAGRQYSSGSSRGRSSSPFGHRKTYSGSYSSSSSSSSSFLNGRLVPRSSPSSVSSHFYGSSNGGTTRSVTPSRSRTEYARGRTVPAGLAAGELVVEPEDSAGSGDSISATIRFRPMSDREFQRGDEIAWYADGDKMVRSEYNPATFYAFDRVFGPTTTTEAVYNVAARPVVKAAMEGINGTVFAYGVTSSGKTHTMHGDPKSPGIIPLAIKDVFSIIQDTPGREFLLRVSYIEIYNEVINDLLDPTGQNLRVREDAHGTYVEGIKEEVVLSPGHVLSFIAAGEEHRHVGSNNFNLFSSRSHTIFTLMIESSAHGDEYDGVMYSQLNLIDLAGSESSKTETTGIRRKEGSYINKSLLTLGTVIGKLSEGRACHIPYRDSKLTRLLQSSLSGHGHVSLICTVTPASSNMEETHNTLKFASRAKRVEIYASCNRIIDEKSLIKKYQKEISILKQELEQFRKGMLGGATQEEIMSLRQQLEEGQVKMQSRLEEEEEAKAALMSRIQRLTKLILVSTKNSIPGCLTDVPRHQRSLSLGEDDKLDMLSEISPLVESESTMNDSVSSVLSDSLDTLANVKSWRHSSKLKEEHSAVSGSVTDSMQTGTITSDEMDLLVEQVKMLAGEIAFNTSTLKRLMEQSVDDPDGRKTQIESLEREIQDKQRQMRVLEQRITENGEASMANASLVDMQQTVMRLMTQCNEKAFELELKSADNRILQEQLQQKCSENKELEDKVSLLQQQQLTSLKNERLNEEIVPEENNSFKSKLRSQEAENEKLNLDRLQLIEENNGLLVQNQQLAEEASYAKELASAAAVELKNLAEEVTRLTLQNARQAKELLAAHDLAYSKTANGTTRRFSESKNDAIKLGRRSRPPSRNSGPGNTIFDDVENWNLDLDDIRMELQVRKQRESNLEAALAEKEHLEEEYKRKIEEGRKREKSLENDLANMWVLVAKLKKGVLVATQFSPDQRSTMDNLQLTSDEHNGSPHKEELASDTLAKSNNEQLNQNQELEPLLVRLKARIQEMKEREFDSSVNGETNSHVCKVCFESPTAAVLLPCRHFCLCKPCSLACSECPLCRTKIVDRIITFTS